MTFPSEGPVVVKAKDREAAWPSPGAGPARCLQSTSSLLRTPHLLGSPWSQALTRCLDDIRSLLAGLCFLSQGGPFSVHSHSEPGQRKSHGLLPCPPMSLNSLQVEARSPHGPHSPGSLPLPLPPLTCCSLTPLAHPTLQPLASFLFQSSLALASAVPSAWHTLPTCWLLPAHQRSKTTFFLSKPFPDPLRETAAPPSCPHSIARDPSCFPPHLTSHRHVGCCHSVGLLCLFHLSPVPQTGTEAP